MARALDPDAVIRGILGRFHDKGEQQVGRSRATLVLEPGLAPLAPALTDANFIVIPADDLKIFERRREVLPGRVLLTRNAADFIDDAPILEMGVLGLDALGSEIVVGPTLSESATALLISKAFIAYDLAAERAGYLLLLHPAERHVFRRLS